MKFLFLIQTLSGGGAERMVSRISNSLSHLGHKVSILLSYKASNEYDTNNVNIIYLADSQNNYNKINRLKRLILIRKYINSIKPDIIIPLMEHISQYAIYSTTFTKYRKKLVMTIRDNPELSNQRKLINMIKKVKLCLVQNDGQKKVFPLSTRNKIVVIPNFVDNEIFDINKKYNKNIKNIICVGRFTEQKNYPLLINAINKCKDLDIFVTVYGDGVLKQKIFELIKTYGIENKIQLMNFTNCILNKYIESDLYIMTSNFEGMPNTLLEASSLGLPAISTDCHFGPSDIIISGKNGILVPCNDVKSLASAIRYYVNNPNVANEHGRNGKRLMMTRYSEKDIITKWEQLPFLLKRD